MRSNEERIRLMHERAAGLQKKKEGRLLLSAGGISTALFALLIGLTIYLQGLTGYAGDQFTASSMLSESAGGYVLVAVVFFMLGVLITALLKKYQIRKCRKAGGDLPARLRSEEEGEETHESARDWEE